MRTLAARIARNLASAVLLLLVIPLVTGSGYELTGMLGGPNLLGAIAFTLAAQLAALSAGFVAFPKEGKVGVPRAIAYTFFLVQTVGLPSSLSILAYAKVKGLDLELTDIKELTWVLVGSSSASVLVLLLAKPWHLLKRRPAIN